jgi:hypothetical protein
LVELDEAADRIWPNSVGLQASGYRWSRIILYGEIPHLTEIASILCGYAAIDKLIAKGPKDADTGQGESARFGLGLRLPYCYLLP